MENQIKTDDLAFSAWLKINGHKLINSDKHNARSIFVFDIPEKDENRWKIEFVNSKFLEFYNETRNLKKML